MPTSSLSEVQSGIGKALISTRRGPPVSSESIVAGALVGLIGAGLAGMLSRPPAPPRRRRAKDTALDSADSIKKGAAVLAASVLVDSAFEHFRGNFQNRLMYVPPASAAATITTSLSPRIPRRLRSAIFGTSAAIGLSGLGLHLYNIMKRPGGLSWNNLFYAAPIAAPGALTLSGVLGFTAGELERRRESRSAERVRREVGRGLAFVVVRRHPGDGRPKWRCCISAAPITTRPCMRR